MRSKNSKRKHKQRKREESKSKQNSILLNQNKYGLSNKNISKTENSLNNTITKKTSVYTNVSKKNLLHPPKKGVVDPMIFIDQCFSREDLNNVTKKIVNIYARNGTFQKRINSVGEFTVLLDEKENLTDFIYLEGMNLTVKKIPMAELNKIKAFFLAVCKKHSNSEAVVHIYLDKTTQNYETVVLDQDVSGAHVSYSRHLDYENDSNKILVMDIHSHDTMGAFFSGTDDRDEKQTRVYGVIGKVTSPEMLMKFRYSFEGIVFKEISKEEVFDCSCEELSFNQNITLDELLTLFPSEWMEKVKSKTFSSIHNYNNINALNPTIQQYDSFEDYFTCDSLGFDYGYNYNKPKTAIDKEAATSKQTYMKEDSLKREFQPVVEVGEKSDLNKPLIKEPLRIGSAIVSPASKQELKLEEDLTSEPILIHNEVIKKGNLVTNIISTFKKIFKK